MVVRSHRNSLNRRATHQPLLAVERMKTVCLVAPKPLCSVLSMVTCNGMPFGLGGSDETGEAVERALLDAAL
jgi:hypothetical protein